MSTPTLVQTDLAEQLTAEVRTRFTERRDRAARYGPAFARLWDLAAAQAEGGKLVRPVLLVRTHSAMSAATGRSHVTHAELLQIASSLELLHFAFLLHDDVIDGDLYRRGRPNLVGTLLTERRAADDDAASSAAAGLHWGQTGAILAGNLVLSQVHQVFARAGVPDAVRERLLDLLDEAITETVAGEHADVALSDGVIEPDLDTILSTAARKTATYSFALPLRIAAVLADAPETWDAPLETIGRHLGLAFQLQDDYLSTFGSAALHGKDRWSDLREGKQTAIIAFARMTSRWPLVREKLGNRALTEEDAEHIVAELRACGADRFIEGLIADHLAAIAELLAADDDAAKLPAGVQHLLHELTAVLTGRRS